MIIRRTFSQVDADQVSLNPVHFETDSDVVLIGDTQKTLSQKLSEYDAQRTITLSGNVTGTAQFSSTGAISITTTVVDDSHNHNLSTLKAGTASRVVVSGSDKTLTVCETTMEEIGYLHGVTSDIQSQLNDKAPTSHGVHVTYGAAVGAAPTDTGAIGTSDAVSRADHAHPKQTDISGNAGTADALKTSRNLKVNLASESAASFNGGADANLGVYGTLPVAHGGTGTTDGTAPYATQLKTGKGITVDLAKTTAGTFDGSAAVDVGVKGVLGVAYGGTGATTAEDARTAIGAAASGHNHDSTYLKQNLRGAANGVAPLGNDSLIPAAYLPSFVDDVLEGTVSSDFTSFTKTGESSPVTPEKGKIYTDTSTNLTYRWSGTIYTEISKSLALGETETTAYRGDRGAAAYLHSRQDHAPADANKVEASTTNGKIKIAGVETTVYTHPSITCSAGTATGTLSFGGTFDVISAITVDGNGHTTAKTTKTFTMPAAPTTVSGNAGTASALQNAQTIDGVSFKGNAGITHYGACTTAAGTSPKAVDCTGFTLAAGARIIVKFSNTNTVASPKMNVNSTGEKSIMYRGSAINAGYLEAGHVYEFVYDGTNYELVGDIAKSVSPSDIGAAAASHGTHVSYPSSGTPAALGTASNGSASTVARSDHVHALPALTSCTGTLTVAKGGTGSTTAAGARTNLGVINVQYGSTQPTNQAAGDLWFQNL